MSNVTKCLREDCLYCKDYECTNDGISINEDKECGEHELYIETREYQEPYYVCIKVNEDDSKKSGTAQGTYKRKKYGKKIVIDGVTYYTGNDTRTDNFSITEATSGILLNKAFALQNDMSIKIAVALKEQGYNNVTELVEVDKVWKNGESIFVIVDERTFEVIWDDENARFLGRHSKPRGDAYICYVGRIPAVEVIGNIFDNPELFKSKE